MKRILYSFLLVFITINIYADNKKPLNHSVYNSWNYISGYAITDDGKYCSYQNNKNEGDCTLEVINLKDNSKIIIPRGINSKFTPDGKHITFIIKPTYSQQKATKKLKEDKRPKDSLGIMNLNTNEIVKFPKFKDIEIPKEKGDYIAFKIEDTVTIYDLLNNRIYDTLQNIESFSFDKNGTKLVCVTKANNKKIFVYNVGNKLRTVILEGNKKSQILAPYFAENGNMICFYANIDSTKKIDEYVEIYTYKFGAEKAIKVVDSTIIGLPKEMIISKNRALSFNKSCDRLFFGIAQTPMKRDTSINDEEIAKLDVWNYKDDYISPQQLKMKSTMQKRSYLSYINIDTISGQAINNTLIRLATEEYPFIIIPKEKSGDVAYSFSNEKYAAQSQWDANPIGDLYFISIKDGSKKLIKEGLYATNMKASPNGEYLIWYDPQQKNWFSIELSMNSSEPINITKEINYPLWQELHDIPKMAPPYGEGGWNYDDRTFYVYDKYDVWAIDPSGKNKPISITQGLGRKNGYTFKLIRLDELQLPEGTPGIKNNPIKTSDDLYFTAFDNKSKGYGYYTRSNKKGKLLPMRKLIMEPDFSLGYLNKAKNANVITYTKSNFTECPNLWVTKNFFKTSKKLTDVNPQQKDYIWGTCELVYWTSKDGEKLEGLLYKPENFDSTKAYPMVVYFYERNSDNKNVYRRPNVSKSTINVSYFVSNGYLVFIPDICYKIGHPGKSAYNCIVPGVEKLCKNKWVDKNNIAIQGQSWGGYQVAYLVTQTNMFKCAGAGAPVTNMTSAYGGIRWGTGRVRQFQYEHTQSRIGKSLWDKGGLELYLENSPLFYADKVNTPLLIMHNDDDEAVPWYQGIEYFTALRRLGKQVWMLQYNGETHNLSKRVNALDYTIRLSQFMDHFLKGAPMPVWMDKGIPATEKGINMGLDLIEKN